MYSVFEELAAVLDLDYILGNSCSSSEPHPHWKQIPMVQWSADDVLDFINSEFTSTHKTTPYSSTVGLLEPSNTQRFACISGYIFKSLGEEYCQRLANSKAVGEIIFAAKEFYLRNNSSNEADCYSVENKVNSEEDWTKKAGRPKTNTRKRRKEKSEKLWEFLLHLLRDNRNELIKWENFEEGTFKFVKNDTVARLWGSRNHNQTMNYEKFTRAMRYHYKSKVLLPVPGKRLVYKFGPHAMGGRDGWQSSLPVC